MPRADARTDYRQFPQSYFDLLDAYRERLPTQGRIALGPMSRKHALVARRDLHRFKMMLTNADPGDAVARDLAELFGDIMLSIEPIATEPVDGRDSLLVLCPNPVASAMAALSSA